MKSYYKGNALYKYIAGNKLERFSYVTGNLWQLVYGNNNCEPKVLVTVSGVSESEYGNINKQEIKADTQLKVLALEKGITCLFVQFRSDIEFIESIMISSDIQNDTLKQISLEELRERFNNCGLSVSNTQTGKYLNDKTSSAYHNWQRSSLGRNITVSDIDLWISNKEMKFFAVCELKRSKIAIENWEPYTDDYRNFQLIHNLINPKYKFFIIYNLRVPKPFKDDISKLKIFEVDFTKSSPIKNRGIYPLDEIIK